MRSFALRALPFAIATLVLAGCGAGGDGAQRLENYAERLSRPLGEAISAPTPAAPPLPPRAGALQLRVESGDLEGLDFLRLRGCALQSTVARRNSSLGRVAPASQRLLLELAFLRDAPACIALLREEGKAELAATLRDAQATKKRQLPALIFNATLGSREYRDFWRADAGLGNYPADTASVVITALERVTTDAARWLGGDYSADGARLELALGDIALGDGGELLRALALQAAWLAAADSAITRRLADGPLCVAGRRPSAAPILRTVVQKYFVGDVQPWSAALNQRYHDLLGPLMALEALVGPVLPEAYGSYGRRRDELIDAARHAPADHVRSLQSLLGPCYAAFARDDDATPDE